MGRMIMSRTGIEGACYDLQNDELPQEEPGILPRTGGATAGNQCLTDQRQQIQQMLWFHIQRLDLFVRWDVERKEDKLPSAGRAGVRRCWFKAASFALSNPK